MGDALHTGGTTAGGAGVTSAREARLAQAGLIATQGPSILDARTGVMVGPGSTALVTGTPDTAPMAYNVAPHQWVASRRAADGPYLGALDAVRKVTTTAAPGSGSRIDVVWVRQADNDPTVLTPDTITEDQYGVTQGVPSAGTPTKPAIPAGAVELAVVTVAAGATRTDGAGVTITNSARQTTARGGTLPLRTQAERVALQTAGAAYPTLEVLELDTGRRLWHDGTRFRHEGDRVTVPTRAARDALVAYDGLVAVVTSSVAADAGQWLRSGGVWVRLDAWNVISELPANAGIPVPVQGSPGQLDAVTVRVPAGRVLDVRYHIPLMRVLSSSAAYLRIFVPATTSVLGNVEYQTGANTNVAQPLTLEGSVPGTGADIDVRVQCWAGSGVVSVEGSPATGAGPRFSYRIR